MIRNWEHTPKPPTGHTVVLPMVCKHTALPTVAKHVFVAMARFIMEGAP